MGEGSVVVRYCIRFQNSARRALAERQSWICSFRLHGALLCVTVSEDCRLLWPCDQKHLKFYWSTDWWSLKQPNLNFAFRATNPKQQQSTGKQTNKIPSRMYKRVWNKCNACNHIQGVPGGMCQKSGVFLMLNYTDIIQNTYVQSWTVTEIIAKEKRGLHRCRRTVRSPWRHTCPMRLPDNQTS